MMTTLRPAYYNQETARVESVSQKLQRGGKTMKAAFIERHGGPEVLQVGNRPEPAPRADKVVIEIA